MSEGVSPLGTIRVVSIEDPALDLANMQAAEYVRSRDPKLVKARTGQTLTWYVLRPLPRELLFDFVDGTDDQRLRWRRALACCLEQIENPSDPTSGEQRPVPFVPETIPIDEHGTRVARTRDIERMVQPPGAVYELGKLCYDRAHLHPLARGVCVPPPGSVERASALLLRAAPSEASSPPPTESPDV